MRILGIHQPQQCPRRINNLTPLWILRINPKLTTLKTLPPPPILSLPPHQKLTSPILRLRILIPLPHTTKTLHRKTRRIRKTNPPTPIPRSIRPLIRFHPLTRPFNRAINVPATVLGVIHAAKGERGNDCGGTFRVTVFYHDATKDFGGIDEFHPGSCATEVVRGEAAVGVLVGEGDGDGGLETRGGDEG